jgi:GT2 family glycosyltransferase
MLSVIVPVFRNATLVEYSLVHLSQNLPSCAELIIVDDASDAETLSILRKLANAHLVEHRENRGNTSAYNTGAAAARGEVLVFIDSDVFVSTETLEDLVEVVTADETAGAVGSLLLFPYDYTIQHAGVAFDRWTLSHLFVGRPCNAVRLAEVEPRQAVTAALFACSRALFEKIGGFDETYRDGLEDIEFCLRCCELGRKNLLLSRHPALHLESATRGPHKNIRRTYNYSIFFSRWAGRFEPDLCRFVEASLHSALEGFSFPAYPATVLNFCTTPNWLELADAAARAGVRLGGSHNLSGSIGEPEPIDLFRTIPLLFQRSPAPLLFTVDHFLQLSRNRYWFQRRAACDLIVDRHANVILSCQIGYGPSGEK